MQFESRLSSGTCDVNCENTLVHALALGGIPAVCNLTQFSFLCTHFCSEHGTLLQAALPSIKIQTHIHFEWGLCRLGVWRVVCKQRRLLGLLRYLVHVHFNT